MPLKIYLKIYGLRDVDDLKLVESNLKSQDGIRTIKFFPLDGYSGVKMEIDDSLTKEQVFDIIKISGDFKIEDLTEPKKKQAIVLNSKSETKMINHEPDKDKLKDQTVDSKIYFFGGLLIGFSAVSLIINLILGYLLITK